MDPAPRSDPMEPGLLEALASPDAYPDDPSAVDGVESVQTHISCVFLTRHRVYKLRKSVDLGFVSFLARDARNRDCLHELHLNRRLAPDVYLGIAPVERADGGFRVGALLPDPTSLPDVEHCVVMRRLPAGRDARSLLEAGALRGEQLDRVAVLLADFHHRHGLGRPSPFTPEAWRARIWQPVEANFTTLLERGAGIVAPGDVQALRERAERTFDRIGPTLEERRLAGRAVDAHGDLHLEHVWFERDDAQPLVIDCLEFNDELRRIDAASELAFLAMDLGYRGHRELAERLLERYARAADDYGLYRVLEFFVSYRSAVRAKVETLAAVDPALPEDQREHAKTSARRRLAFATRALDEPAPGRVFLTGGIIGAGKSTAARAVARATGAVVIASDVVRRQVFGPPAAGHPGWQQERYAPEAVERVYDALFARAEPVLASGRSLVLDASWSSRSKRERARAWAEHRGAAPVFVEVRCPRDVTVARLAARQRDGRDPSDAGPGIYDAFAASFQAVHDSEWPAGGHWVVSSDEEGWDDALGERARGDGA